VISLTLFDGFSKYKNFSLKILVVDVEHETYARLSGAINCPI
jgi:hypothetical protein